MAITVISPVRSMRAILLRVYDQECVTVACVFDFVTTSRGFAVTSKKNEDNLQTVLNQIKIINLISDRVEIMGP